ncbi:DUF551 domain-containing protein [Serratia marcescens]|uniref:DUF551 domain-containing protein n=1 Tax=Serratia marcescens TaxID=615 RepID=UPI0029DBFAA6|nr:DUF551 domain-containing protein [Serratia marcescens]MDX7275502.1 DUF551 domain-containing protein [Serratia marcescens]
MKEELYDLADLADHIARSKGALPPVWQDWASEIEMAVRKMANREAQPVEYGDAYQGAREDLSIWKRRALEAEDKVRHLEKINDHLVKEAQGEHRMGEPMLAAPPAPAVPEEITEDEQEESVSDGYADSFRGGWNACRAAMLNVSFIGEGDMAQPVSGSYTLNSPVIPDGWIACSEQMPDNDETKPIAIYTGKCLGQGMFVATYDEDGFFDYWEGGEIIGVTHWMPLPAAPEGGNG